MFFDHVLTSVSRKIGIAVILMLTIPLLSISYARASETDPFSALKTRLIQDGFKTELIQKLYEDSRTQFDAVGISLYFIHRESELNYDQFLADVPIHNAKIYLNKYKSHFDEIEKQYSVDRNIITAILLVETRLGAYLGKRRVFNTLSTMAALADPAVREYLWKWITDPNRLPKKRYIQKAEKKSQWAYGELVAFLKYVEKEKLDPLSIYGSYAGAMGIPQFMPSNISFLAQDGDKDGKIDLFGHEDAIASVANYLKYYGWKPGLGEEEAFNVLYYYNHSSYYVDTLMKITKILEKPS